VRHTWEERWGKDGPIDCDEEKCHTAAVDFEEAGCTYWGRHSLVEYVYVDDDGIGSSEVGPGRACRTAWKPPTPEQRICQDRPGIAWAGVSFVSHNDLPFNEAQAREWAQEHLDAVRENVGDYAPDDEDDDDDE
jgi:hypothetical protein